VVRRLVLAPLLTALLSGALAAPGSAAERPVGVLIADHGEPPVYNEDTYWSFRAFIDHLMTMGVIPSWLRAVDTGTILQDEGCYDCGEPSLDAHLIDAWLRTRDGPGVFVPRASDSLAAHYVMPGGPGLAEPDIFEHAGFQVWDEWRRMGGRSPNYDEKLPKKNEVARRLRARYGERVAIRVGYGIDPRIQGRRQGLKQAVEALVRRDQVRALVVAYHGVGFSDIMQTHMIRHEIHEALEDLGAKIPVRFAEPIGRSAHYRRAVVEKVRSELTKVPASAAVAVHLSGHGLPTAACGDYDCGADAYHAYSRELFARTKKAIAASVKRTGRLGVFHVYGDGGEGDSDPEDEVDGPNEALAKRKTQGFRYVIDVPYEFDSNSRDTLIVLRHGYGREPPDWNSRYESQFERDGLKVKIANAYGGSAHKIAALEEMIGAQLGGWIDSARVEAGHHEGHN
jgi:hypothetical protein